VAYFLSSALREEATADQELALLREYHQRLDVSDYPFETFHRDYQRAMLIVLAGLAGAGDVDLANERGATMMAAWMRRLAARAATIDPGTLL